MPATTFQKCKTVIKKLQSHGLEVEAPVRMVDLTIKRYIGADKRTVDKYKSCLVEFGFLEPINDTVFKINKSENIYHE